MGTAYCNSINRYVGKETVYLGRFYCNNLKAGQLVSDLFCLGGDSIDVIESHRPGCSHRGTKRFHLVGIR